MLERTVGRRVLVAILIGASLASTSAFAVCPTDEPKHQTHPTKTHTQDNVQPKTNDCVDFDAVPQISAKVVADEHLPQPVNHPAASEPATPAYTGPTVGMAAPGVKPAPTIGYRWSID